MSDLPVPAFAEEAWWSHDVAALMAALATAPAGLEDAEAARRKAAGGPNALVRRPEHVALRLLLHQFASPLVLILVAGGVLSLLVRDWTDAALILAIVVATAGLGFTQELRASRAVDALQRRLALSARVRRSGAARRVPVEDLVPGDVVELSAGNLVPADGVLVTARDFLVTQASLTGESLPVEKQPGVAPAGAALPDRTNAVFAGSSVRSGEAELLVVRTGAGTVLAGLSAHLLAGDEESDFERGVRHFGTMLLRLMMGVVIVVLVANQLLGRPPVESLLFAVALAVGLSPELLPVIVSVSLARGATRLARSGVLVRRLDAIEDLGAMNVLLTDKTGTLTQGEMALAGAVDADGRPSDEVLRLAHLNAAFETGIDNPIDAALVEAGRRAGLATDGWTKLDEIPYDFVRRRLTVVLCRDGGEPLMITKGAVPQVLAACRMDDAARAAATGFMQRQGAQGLRVLAVACGQPARAARFSMADEQDLRLAGFVCFRDPVKPDAARVVQDLAHRGVRVAMVTGDNRHVAARVAAEVGLDGSKLLTGEAIAGLRDEALWHLAERTACFAEVEPAQKERIVRALQRRGHAVGFLGDGINDAPALHAADVGISVEQAVDVARESADLVLLRADLAVIERGIAEGRRTFANTLKYIQITTSANFGNMISMALATPLLPFLPLTAGQILLNNFLSDLPSLAIATDRVDPAALRRARRWNHAELRRFMIVFGLLSSIFDLLTFGLLLKGFGADAATFHGGWFLVSLLTELAVVLVLRTHGAAWRSRPSRLLLVATLAVTATAVLVTVVPAIAAPLGFAPLPPGLLLALLAIVSAYLLATEAAKRRFFGRAHHRAA
jgi:Mg2+-importing ATPase